MTTKKVEAPVVEAVEEGLSLEKSYDKFIKSQNTGDGLLTEDYDKLEVISFGRKAKKNDFHLTKFKCTNGTEEIERAHWVSQGHLDALAREQGGEAVDYLDKDGKITDVEADMVKVKVHYSKLNLFSDEKGIIRVISL